MSSVFEEMHHMEPHIQVARARTGVIMLIVSDALSIIAIVAAGGYLNTLNVAGQFRAGDTAPAFLPGLLLAIVLVLSGLTYFLWERKARSAGVGPRAFVMLAVALMVVALVVQLFVARGLGYAAPFHAYASLILLITWYSAAHLLLAAIIGILLLGRVMRGRLASHPYIAEVTGYWWYYTIIGSLVMWAFALLIS